MRKPHNVLFLSLFLVLCPLPAFAVLVGPFTGTVVDSRTGDPIEGASVLMFWTKVVSRGPLLGPGSFPVKATLVYTDREGRYSIPKFNADIGLLGALEATHIIIYQPSYEAYIVNICYADAFCQKNDAVKEKNNFAKLDRIPPGFSHKEHVEKIERSLGCINDYLHIGDTETWNRVSDINILIVPPVEEFLRKTEWESRRGDKQ